MNLPEKYKYRYEKTLFCGYWSHTWILVGEHGGMHLNIRGYKSDKSIEYSAGLETHYRKPPEYMKGKPPSHDECFILKTPCWHDGTSLYASEKYVPLFRNKVDDEIIFASMAMDADRNLEGVL